LIADYRGVHDQIVRRRIAALSVHLEVEALGKEHSHRVLLLQFDLFRGQRRQSLVNSRLHFGSHVEHRRLQLFGRLSQLYPRQEAAESFGTWTRANRPMLRDLPTENAGHGADRGPRCLALRSEPNYFVII
jgi:hypothetical protein